MNPAHPLEALSVARSSAAAPVGVDDASGPLLLLLFDALRFPFPRCRSVVDYPTLPTDVMNL
jgi:hypothetical protein